jgi:hypothetical protein
MTWEEIVVVTLVYLAFFAGRLIGPLLVVAGVGLLVAGALRTLILRWKAGQRSRYGPRVMGVGIGLAMLGIGLVVTFTLPALYGRPSAPLAGIGLGVAGVALVALSLGIRVRAFLPRAER